MQHLIEAVEQALEQQNWYAALALALTLPDICGWLEQPQRKTGERYKEWFKKYMPEYYSESLNFPLDSLTNNVEATHINKPFLTAEDFYALRCAYLHSGSDDISSQARTVLDKFCFVAPRKHGGAHCNKVIKDKHHTLQLQVDIFCGEICHGVKLWEKKAIIKDGVRERLTKELMKIYPLGVF
ncbi:hypothetical protein IQ230_09675 [Gloeocapsopsis crepidinum LEGE 06123]|uniref:Uncharacterized protein n=1 Tax=Gloeocapsopsis crepidinum LEGE 06123 TaxID=588587 RepID=A0ABR9URE5_9CHRO|nr:hypothetical protein [Gloeocapsopsis crepidinum]MBE9190625.1 hypothetical protein [Gloeocapsopsis crepidinum LEGE 06123]